MSERSVQKMSYNNVGLWFIQEAGMEAGLGTCNGVAWEGAHGPGLS